MQICKQGRRSSRIIHLKGVQMKTITITQSLAVTYKAVSLVIKQSSWRLLLCKERFTLIDAS